MNQNERYGADTRDHVRSPEPCDDRGSIALDHPGAMRRPHVRPKTYRCRDVKKRARFWQFIGRNRFLREPLRFQRASKRFWLFLSFGDLKHPMICPQPGW